MDCDLVEVTSHAGARPSHAVWQGGIYSLSGKSKKYRPFKQSTGYGTGEGLGGWNCRHNFFPFLPGASTPTFDKDPNRLLGKSNAQVYEESQRQRELERRVRASRRACTALDAAVNSEADEKLRALLKEDFDSASLLLKRREAALKDYCLDTGRTLERDRMTVFGYNRSVGGKAGAAAKRTKAENVIRDELRAAGLKGKIHFPPLPIDTGSLTFDDEHINAERGHRVMIEMAKSFIHDAVMSVTVWDGQFERYYSYSGATYVNVEANLIRTSFSANEFDDYTTLHMEVLKEHGK